MIMEKKYVQFENFENFKGDDLYNLLHKILHYLRHITGAEAGTIYLQNNNNLEFSIFQNDTFGYEKNIALHKPLQEIKLEIKEDSHSVTVESYATDKMITIDDIYGDKDFNFLTTKEFDKKFDYKTKSIITAPLKNFFDNSKIGVIQLINKKERDNYISFNSKDKEAISLTSHLITLSINAAQDKMIQLQNIQEVVEKKIRLRTQNMQKIQEQLIDEANTDPLTGLKNRRYFNYMIEDMYELSTKDECEGSLLIIDIDNFKKVNDTYGHIVGDEVLMNLAKLIQNSVRDSDICVRYGGEEFVILLPFTKIKNAIVLGNKLLKRVSSEIIRVDTNIDLEYTISIGISQADSKDQSSLDILNRADKALYQAKHLGKNRVEVY